MAKQFLSCKVHSVTPVSAEIFRLDCGWARSAPQAGQFFMLKPENSGVFLPRPISAAMWDTYAGTLSFLILRRGKGTEELAALHPGETIELSGPLGNSWEDFLPPADPSIDTASTDAPFGGAGAMPEKPCALIGGGIGIAPLLSLPLRYPGRFDFYAGFRTLTGQEENAFLYPIKPFVNKLVIATEIDSGNKSPRITRMNADGKTNEEKVSVAGKIPDFLNPADYSAVCACGPEAMLRVVAEKCAVMGIPCYVSLERRMACGVGACLGCTVSTSRGNRRCCADGPIFPAATLVF